jgi:hypothetical protein
MLVGTDERRMGVLVRELVAKLVSLVEEPSTAS